MTSRVNDLAKVETSFYRNLGNGKAAAADFATMIHSVVSSRDTTVFTRQMDKIRKHKSDTVAIRAMATVIRSVWPGAKMKVNKETGLHSIVIKGIKADKEAVSRMDEAVTRGLSLRDTFAKAVVGESAEEDIVADAAFYDKLAKSIENRLSKAEGATIDALIARLQAKKSDVGLTLKSQTAPKASPEVVEGDARMTDTVTH